jgi:hypothetical protein
MSSAVAVATGDLNGDSIPDVSYTDGNSVCTYLGTGGGGVMGKPCINVHGTGAEMLFADMNGDGKLDVVLNDFGSSDGSIKVLMGAGDGTFGSYIASPQFGNLADIAVADVNHDGKLDVVGTDFNNGVDTIVLGNGDGTFQSSRSAYAVGQNPSGNFVPALALADFDLSGSLDIASTNQYNNSFSVLLARGDGTFQGAQAVLPATASGNVSQALPAVGDFNGDGKLDLAMGFSSAGPGSPSALDISLSSGGALTYPYLDYMTADLNTVCSLTAADLDNDGHLDLIANQGGATGVYLGDGSGQFPTQYQVVPGPSGGWPNGCTFPENLALGDFNNDGKLDFAMIIPQAGSGGEGVLDIETGNGNGTFNYAGNYVVGNQGPSPISVATGDFNGDGYVDLAVIGHDTSLSGYNVYILLGDGMGGFSAPAGYATGASSTWLAMGDFNRDGKLDLVTVNTNNNSASILLGNGDGTFGGPQLLALNPGVSNPNYVVVSDFNGDGILDLAVGSPSLYGQPNSGLVQIYLGNGDGTFEPIATDFEVGAGTYQPETIGDFNGDGAPDLAVANNSGVVILLNTTGTSAATTSSMNPSHFKQAVTFTATVSASVAVSGGLSPTGAVTFMDGSTTLGTATLASGNASLTISTLSIGTHMITAIYSGDINFGSHSALPLTQIVKP